METAHAECITGRAILKIDAGVSAFNIEVMDTNETRAAGLMHRKDLPKFSGMLFVYEEPQSVSFWMRNTLIPLDMLFFDETGKLTKIHENAIPMDETPIFGGDSILAVLEINGGLAHKLRISEGAILQHASFDQEIAAWPCKN